MAASISQRSLRFESLERRHLLAITVNSLSDNPDPSNPDEITLRQAVQFADEGEVINFAVVGEIQLSQGEIRIDKSLTIDGPFDDNGSGGLALSIVSPNSRVFKIDDGAGGDRLVVLNRLSMTGSNPQGDGGAIYNAESLELRQSVVTGSSSLRGGGVFNKSGDLSIEFSTISGNQASANFRSGGGLYNATGAVAITATTIEQNSAPLGDGGGILNEAGQLTLADSTVSGNASHDSGGGLYNVGGELVIRSSTISGNAAGDSGGGVYNWSAASGNVRITFSTITANQAPRGAGIAANASLGPGRVYLQATIAAGNFGSDIATVGLFLSAADYFQSGGYNLLGAGNGLGAFAATDIQNIADPGLESLAMNGGPTATHALSVVSPAVDAIDVPFDAPDWDQRGLYYYRHQGDGYDIGSYEVQRIDDSQNPLAAAAGDFDHNGVVDARDLTAPIDGFSDRFGASVYGDDFLSWQRNFTGQPRVSPIAPQATSFHAATTDSPALAFQTHELSADLSPVAASACLTADDRPRHRRASRPLLSDSPLAQVDRWRPIAILQGRHATPPSVEIVTTQEDSLFSEKRTDSAAFSADLAGPYQPSNQDSLADLPLPNSWRRLR